mmetsp:Transcript_18147/g.50784  ORF Transcript_18147/g.50784 Transcript_18147/m.50784 type:complete len:286 (+) Transcript_18147:209-1066(+)
MEPLGAGAAGEAWQGAVGGVDHAVADQALLQAVKLLLRIPPPQVDGLPDSAVVVPQEHGDRHQPLPQPALRYPHLSPDVGLGGAQREAGRQLHHHLQLVLVVNLHRGHHLPHCAVHLHAEVLRVCGSCVILHAAQLVLNEQWALPLDGVPLDGRGGRIVPQVAEPHPDACRKCVDGQRIDAGGDLPIPVARRGSVVGQHTAQPVWPGGGLLLLLLLRPAFGGLGQVKHRQEAVEEAGDEEGTVAQGLAKAAAPRGVGGQSRHVVQQQQPRQQTNLAVLLSAHLPG